VRARIITLDGPAGVGKSSSARLLAERLGLPFLDTGAMFRCIALRVGERGFSLAEEELRNELRQLEFTLSGQGNSSALLCNGENPGQAIRSEAVGALASRLAALPVVRAFTRDRQQALGNSSLVAEGRDMGSTVFPQARPKFFLEARPRVRALRRQRQLAEQGHQAKLEELEAQILQRDELDRNRSLAPLKPAEDALIIDTSDLDQQAVLAELLRQVRRMERDGL
jgi:cytidylate kinase